MSKRLSKYTTNGGKCIENCSSCKDTLCMFHEKNFNEDSYTEIKKIIEERIKNMPAS